MIREKREFKGLHKSQQQMIATSALLPMLLLALGAHASGSESRMDIFFPQVRRVYGSWHPQVLMGGYEVMMCTEYKDASPPNRFNVFVQRDTNWFGRLFWHWKWKAETYFIHRLDTADELPKSANQFDKVVLDEAEVQCKRYFNVTSESNRHYVYLSAIRLPSLSGTRREKPYRFVFKYKALSGRAIGRFWTKFAVQNMAAGLYENPAHSSPIYIKSSRLYENGNGLREYPGVPATCSRIQGCPPPVIGGGNEGGATGAGVAAGAVVGAAAEGTQNQGNGQVAGEQGNGQVSGAQLNNQVAGEQENSQVAGAQGADVTEQDATAVQVGALQEQANVPGGLQSHGSSAASSEAGDPRGTDSNSLRTETDARFHSETNVSP